MNLALFGRARWPWGILLPMLGFIGDAAANTVSIPMGYNSWAFDQAGVCVATRHNLQQHKIARWESDTQRFRTYFWSEKAGELQLRLQATVPAGTSQLMWGYAGKFKELEVSEGTGKEYDLGTIQLSTPGYHYIEWRALTKTGKVFADLEHLWLAGEAAQGALHFIKGDVHFGRRGPSVHLSYRLPREAGEVTWVYNELTVPEGMDPVGTYAMANGFGEGYFGMQVNSPTQRRILFSVWSPFHTDNPREIPEEQRVRLLKKGRDVNAQDFGGEGSGGQSFMVYPWQAGTTYKFLLHVQPDGQGATVYTAYFFATEEQKWRLVASFKRPDTTTYMRHWHSFLENFSPDTGAVTREVQTKNQWAYSKAAQRWLEVTQAGFTADNTAHKRARMDYTGGITPAGHFFMRNCGFTDEHTPAGQRFARPPMAQAPVIDFDALPQE